MTKAEIQMRYKKSKEVITIDKFVNKIETNKSKKIRIEKEQKRSWKKV